MATRFLKRSLMVLVCSLALSIATLRFVSIVEAAKVVTPSIPIPMGARTIATPTQTPPVQVPAKRAATAACTPVGTPASPAPLTMTVPGLQQVVDSPDTYQVYGATNADIAAQLGRCAPISADGNFSATTSYWLGAHYGYSLTPSASCRLSDITVAIHVTQVMPTWQDNSSDALTSKWNAYEHNLALHENGHTIIDISQAGTLLEELTALPAMPCDQITAAANNVVTARLAALDKANDDYDNTTHHGAAQGAIW